MATKTMTRSTGKRNRDCQPSFSMNIKERWRVPLFPKKMSVGILRILQSDFRDWGVNAPLWSTMIYFSARSEDPLNPSIIRDLVHDPRGNRFVYFLTCNSSCWRLTIRIAVSHYHSPSLTCTFDSSLSLECLDLSHTNARDRKSVCRERV